MKISSRDVSPNGLPSIHLNQNPKYDFEIQLDELKLK